MSSVADSSTSAAAGDVGGAGGLGGLLGMLGGAGGGRENEGGDFLGMFNCYCVVCCDIC